MAFFKFRKGGDEQSAPGAPAPESIEAMRKRARYRLAGAFVLVLIGVIGFPLLFDNQPRPIAVDIPIDIPDKAKAKPPAAAEAVTSGASAAGSVAGASAGSGAGAAAAADPKPEAKAENKPEPKAEAVVIPAKPADKTTEKSAEKPVEKPVDKAATKQDEAARAKALLEGKPAQAKADAKNTDATAASKSRFVVQFGSYTDVVKSREARQKVEKAGLKTYAQVVQTADGKKVRVRVGPFETKAEAEKAAAKIKKLDLPTAILEL